MTTPVRNPQLAPVYAAVIAFAVVMGLGYQFDSTSKYVEPSTPSSGPKVKVIIDADLKGIRVGIRPAAEGKWHDATRDSEGNLTVTDKTPLADSFVCVTELPPGWTIQQDIQRIKPEGEQPSICTKDQVTSQSSDTQTVLSVVHPVVTVDPNDAKPNAFKNLVLKLRPAGKNDFNDEKLDRNGSYQRLTETSGGATVCLTQPPEWIVEGVIVGNQTDPIPPNLAPEGFCIQEPGPLPAHEIVFKLRRP